MKGASCSGKNIPFLEPTSLSSRCLAVSTLALTGRQRTPAGTAPGRSPSAPGGRGRGVVDALVDVAAGRTFLLRDAVGGSTQQWPLAAEPA